MPLGDAETAFLEFAKDMECKWAEHDALVLSNEERQVMEGVY